MTVLAALLGASVALNVAFWVLSRKLEVESKALMEEVMREPAPETPKTPEWRTTAPELSSEQQAALEAARRPIGL